jgi:hypothetical protein
MDAAAGLLSAQTATRWPGERGSTKILAAQIPGGHSGHPRRPRRGRWDASDVGRRADTGKVVLRVGTEFHIHHGYWQSREMLRRSGPGCLDLLGNWYLDFLCLRGGLRGNHRCRWGGGNGLNGLFNERRRSKWDWLCDRHRHRLNFFANVPGTTCTGSSTGSTAMTQITS